MTVKRNLTALLHRERCDRHVLIPMLERLSPAETMALWRLIQNIQDDAARDAKSKMRRRGMI